MVTLFVNPCLWVWRALLVRSVTHWEQEPNLLTWRSMLNTAVLAARTQLRSALFASSSPHLLDLVMMQRAGQVDLHGAPTLHVLTYTLFLGTLLRRMPALGVSGEW